SALDVTDELRNVLHAAGVPAPYLFVGHSLGGIYAQRYAQRFPGEVAGMVLLEPPHEDFLNNTPKFKDRKSTRLNSSHVSISYPTRTLLYPYTTVFRSEVPLT